MTRIKVRIKGRRSYQILWRNVNRKETFRRDLFIALWDVRTCVYGYKRSGTVKFKFFNVLSRCPRGIHYFGFHIDAIRKSQKIQKISFPHRNSCWCLFMSASSLGILRCSVFWTWDCHCYLDPLVWAGVPLRHVGEKAPSTAAVFYPSPLITVPRESFPFHLLIMPLGTLW